MEANTQKADEIAEATVRLEQPLPENVSNEGDPLAQDIESGIMEAGTQGEFGSGAGGTGEPDAQAMVGAEKVGHFRNVSDLDDFRSRIPFDARELPWRSIEGGAANGVRYRWIDAEGNAWNVRAHNIDPNAPPGSNASKGWVYRVEVRWGGTGKKYFMDSLGKFHPENVMNPKSSMYDEIIANDTHIMLLGD